MLSGTFSGLTLGLMSLDMMDLRVLSESGTEREKKYAAKIMPVRKRGNFLLCSLLIGNTAVNSALSIVSGSLFGGIGGLVISTLVILYVGEIIPQSICHRFGLVIGAHAIPLVKLFMVITSVLAYPTSKVLDYFLGGESATRYNKSQLRSLLSIHGEAAAQDVENPAAISESEEFVEAADSEYVVPRTDEDITSQFSPSNPNKEASLNHPSHLPLPAPRAFIGADADVVDLTSPTKEELESSELPMRNGDGAPAAAGGGGGGGGSECAAEKKRKEDAREGGRPRKHDRRIFPFMRRGRRSRPGAGDVDGVTGESRPSGSEESVTSVTSTSVDAADAADGAAVGVGSDGADGEEKNLRGVLDRVTPRVAGKRDHKDKDRDRDNRFKDRRKESEKEAEGALTASEMTLLDGAFQFSQKTVVSVMTALDDVFMLSADMSLNFDNMLLIFQSGHSRIPVYDESKENIYGVLFAKDLILLDPEDALPIRYVLSFFKRTLLLVYDSTPLDEMLNIFKRGGGHLALVQRVSGKGTLEQKHETLGVCTLEDLIEELIGQDIVDETDVYTDNVTRKKVRRMRMVDPEILKMFDHNKSEGRLTEKESKVVAAYLAANFDPFSPSIVQSHVLLDLLKEAHIVEYPELSKEENEKLAVTAKDEMTDEEAGGNPNVDEPETSFDGINVEDISSTAKIVRHVEKAANGGESTPSITLYKRGVTTQDALLVISGRLHITAGDDEFVSEAGPWTLLAVKALTDDLYSPDFTARVVERPARLLRVRRRLYRRMVRYSTSRGGPGNSGSLGGDVSQSLLPAVNGLLEQPKSKSALPVQSEIHSRRSKSRGRDLAWGEMGMGDPTTGMLAAPSVISAGAAAKNVQRVSSEPIEKRTGEITTASGENHGGPGP